ncbi:MAG TPA: S9 family peptidase [Candidatus Fermentibacter daniensis]|nr:S9 family peptidase [Candidatus Fermentibacter daniensis]HPH38787.1 S9 family peptidase [Candidatus Fermentibacter daniensis]HQH92461.1 S9 family peptidase [Candidatus Fermentibacter daniensis]HQM40570.1 S9 family peptidase [Candidatus Fermentibacter daniensis]
MRRLMLVSAAVLMVTSAASAGLPGMIPRDVLFGNPERLAPELSPDGSLIAYIAPAGGVLNLWLMNADGSDPRQITFDEGRGVTNYFWAENGRHILYMQDQAGEENTHVYRLDVATGEVTDLTPFEGVKAYVSATDRDNPDMILIEMNADNPMLFDSYEADLNTGALTLVESNPGFILGWIPDENLVVRVAFAMDGEGGQMLMEKDSEGGWTPFLSWGVEEQVYPVRMTGDGSGIYLNSTLGSNTSRLVRYDFATGEETVLASDPLCDAGRVFFDESTVEPRAVSFTHLRTRVEILDPSLQVDYDYLATVHEGDFFITSADHADDRWIVGYTSVDNPLNYYLYDRSEGTAAFLFSAIPALEDYELAEVRPLLIPARDGLMLPSYLTLPAGVDTTGLPTVLFVHGGPWARDHYGYDPITQLLANRGFAVLQVNFRGSSGFGRDFLNAANREWGGAMQDDITDAAMWAVEQGYADPGRLVIAGASYGGYATLAGVAFTPDLYAAAVDLFGPSNLITFRQSVPAYWRPMDALLDARIGSLDEDADMLADRSPMNHADEIRTPLLVIQGANDPRVVQAESDQLVEALRTAGTAVEYVLYADEGHGFALEANNLDFAGRMEEFLARHIEGVRFEPWTPVEGSTASVVE